MRSKHYALLLGSTLLSAGAAHAQSPSRCELLIEPNPHTFAIMDYDPFAGGEPRGEFEVIFINNGGGICHGEVVAELEGEPFGLLSESGESRLPYSLIDEHAAKNVTPVLGETSPGVQKFDVNLKPGEQEIHRYTFTVDSQQISSHGAYRQNVLLSVVDNHRESLGSQQIPLELNVRSSALVGLKGAFERTNAGARVDLGELQTGGTNLPLALYVMSTGGYRITVQSENQGRLRLSDGEWYVPYSLAIGPESINLSQGDQFEILSSGFRNDDHELRILVGDASEKRAGSYSDLLTLTIAPL